MQTLLPFLAAGLIGGSIFILLQPALIRMASALISHSRRFSSTQKERLLATIQPHPSTDPQGDWVLLGLYVISLAAEIFFLSIENAGSARAILVGMFLMLFVRSFQRALQVKGSPSPD